MNLKSLPHFADTWCGCISPLPPGYVIKNYPLNIDNNWKRLLNKQMVRWMSDSSMNEWRFNEWVTIRWMSDDLMNGWRFDEWVTVQWAKSLYFKQTECKHYSKGIQTTKLKLWNEFLMGCHDIYFMLFTVFTVITIIPLQAKQLGRKPYLVCMVGAPRTLYLVS